MTETLPDTPAVLVDLSKAEANLARAQAYADAQGFTLRPHIKTHKLPRFAKAALELGAVGITCQKIGEAEVMADAGIDDILITYNIVGARKLERLRALAGRVKLAVVADSAEVVDGYAAAFADAKAPLTVFVECDTGAGRCGVQNPDEALELARWIAAAPGVAFGGLMTYPPQGGPEMAEARLAETARVLTEAGLAPPVVTSGGSPDLYKGPHEAVTEYRPGTYIYSDRMQVGMGLGSLEDCALTRARDGGEPADGAAGDIGYGVQGAGGGHLRRAGLRAHRRVSGRGDHAAQRGARDRRSGARQRGAEGGRRGACDPEPRLRGEQPLRRGVADARGLGAGAGAGGGARQAGLRGRRWISSAIRSERERATARSCGRCWCGGTSTRSSRGTGRRWRGISSRTGSSGCTRISGTSSDAWRLDFPRLEVYRDEWLRQAAETAATEYAEPLRPALFRAMNLRDIDVDGDRAVLHKRFDGSVKRADGGVDTLDWKTLYFCLRVEGRWRISSFVGYMPRESGRG